MEDIICKNAVYCRRQKQWSLTRLCWLSCIVVMIAHCPKMPYLHVCDCKKWLIQN